jgi:hypothetical protein
MPLLCVAVDDRGRVLSSTEPANGVGSWKIVDIDGEVPLTGVSCASATLCVAFDANGNVLASTEPNGAPAAWESAHVGVSAHDVSCVSTPLCVATNENEVVSSSNPIGRVWQTASVPYVDGGVSCAQPSLCVAFSDSSNAGITASIEPVAGAQAWVRGAGVGARQLSALSCASVTLCVAAEGGLVMLGTTTNELSASLAGSGNGRVQSSPIACPWSTCSHDPPGIIEPPPLTELVCEDIIFASAAPLCQFAFPPGDQVTLTATPVAGDVFSGWSGDCTGIGACSLAMSTSHAVTATFATRAKVPLGHRKVTIARIASLRETNRAFLPAAASTAITGRTATRRPHGTTFSLHLDQRATVTIRIASAPHGRRVGTCKPDSHALDHKPPCAQTSTIAVLTQAGHEGANRIAFSGRLRGKALKAGNYQAIFTATDAAGTSAPRHLGFAIL